MRVVGWTHQSTNSSALSLCVWVCAACQTDPCYINPGFIAQRSREVFSVCLDIAQLQANYSNTATAINTLTTGLGFCNNQCAIGNTGSIPFCRPSFYLLYATAVADNSTFSAPFARYVLGLSPHS